MSTWRGTLPNLYNCDFNTKRIISLGKTSRKTDTNMAQYKIPWKCHVQQEKGNTWMHLKDTMYTKAVKYKNVGTIHMLKMKTRYLKWYTKSKVIPHPQKWQHKPPSYKRRARDQNNVQHITSDNTHTKTINQYSQYGIIWTNGPVLNKTTHNINTTTTQFRPDT
jgi:hypothetical protein